MKEERLLKVLKAPHVSEKSTMAAEAGNTVVFKVAKDANKAEIKAAVEKLFEVEVDSVRTVNVKGKTKRHGMSFGTLNTTVLFASAAIVDFSETCGATSTFSRRSSFMLTPPQVV